MFGNWGGNGLALCATLDWKGPLQQDSDEGFEMMMWALDGEKGLNWGGKGGT